MMQKTVNGSVKAVAYTTFLLATSLSFSSQQALAEAVAIENFTGTQVSFDLIDDVFNIGLRVTGPEDFVAEDFSQHQMPSLDLNDHAPVYEGTYRYEITAASHSLVRTADGSDAHAFDDEITDYINNGYMNKAVSQTGQFHVIAGQIVVPEDIEEN